MRTKDINKTDLVFSKFNEVVEKKDIQESIQLIQKGDIEALTKANNNFAFIISRLNDLVDDIELLRTKINDCQNYTGAE